MTKSSGLGQRLYVGGVNLSGDIGSIDNAASPLATIDMTGIDKSAMERVAGLKDGALDYVAYYNPDGAHPTLSALPTADVHQLYATGTAIGDPAAGLVAKQIGYDPKLSVEGEFIFTVSSLAAAGTGLEWGRLLTAATRTDSAASNGASYDGGAASAFGLTLYVQLIALTGTSVTVKVQESSDDGAIDTFADVTGATSGALTVPGGVRVATGPAVAVERYLRIATTGTFTSAEFVAMVVRNPVAPS